MLTRKQLLHEVARNYINSLTAKNFDAIPYADNVSLRAPFTPRGIWQPVVGKENLRQQWWAPMPSLLGKVTFIDSFVNENETAVTVQFHCEIINPSCVLRVIDRFTVNEDGLITEQENFLDPRAVTNP
jgi:hypothetical protein